MLTNPRFSTARLCPWIGRAGRDLLSVLLAADEPLSITELTDRAGRDRSTFYEYRSELIAAGVLEETAAGWRLTLSFADDGEERFGDDVLPWFVMDAEQTTLQDVLWEAVSQLVEPNRFDDPTDPVCGPFLEFPFDVDWLRGSWWWGRSWIDRIRRAIDAPERTPLVTQFGVTLEQTALNSGDHPVGRAVVRAVRNMIYVKKS